MRGTLQQAALAALMACDPADKIGRVTALAESFAADAVACEHPDAVRRIAVPGRPPRPELVDPHKLQRRGLGSVQGRASLVHAVAHIEFNAINLALDAVYRFADLPRDYYLDWLAVARDEARHFQMLGERLQTLEYAYGDFPAHDGLWEMAVKTDHSLVTRMALVPRVLEARGLDVSPGMIRRLDAAGDGATADVLRVILTEEEGHVAIGTRWFDHACRQDGLDPHTTFRMLIERHASGMIREPFNEPARLRCGFDAQDMALLHRVAAGKR